MIRVPDLEQKLGVLMSLAGQADDERRGELLPDRPRLIHGTVRGGNVILDVGFAISPGEDQAVAPEDRDGEPGDPLPRELGADVPVHRIESRAAGICGRRTHDGRLEKEEQAGDDHSLTFGFCSATVGRVHQGDGQ